MGNRERQRVELRPVAYIGQRVTGVTRLTRWVFQGSSARCAANDVGRAHRVGDASKVESRTRINGNPTDRPRNSLKAVNASEDLNTPSRPFLFFAPTSSA